MKEAYRRWYKRIGDDANDETIGIEAKIEIEIRGWGTHLSNIAIQYLSYLFRSVYTEVNTSNYFEITAAHNS